MINSAQIKAARGFLDWQQSDLAQKTELSLATIKRMEGKGVEFSTYANVKKVMQAFEEAGIVFTSTGGIEPKETT